MTRTEISLDLFLDYFAYFLFEKVYKLFIAFSIVTLFLALILKVLKNEKIKKMKFNKKILVFKENVELINLEAFLIKNLAFFKEDSREVDLGNSEKDFLKKDFLNLVKSSISTKLFFPGFLAENMIISVLPCHPSSFFLSLLYEIFNEISKNSLLYAKILESVPVKLEYKRDFADLEKRVIHILDLLMENESTSDGKEIDRKTRESNGNCNDVNGDVSLNTISCNNANYTCKNYNNICDRSNLSIFNICDRIKLSIFNICDRINLFIFNICDRIKLFIFNICDRINLSICNCSNLSICNCSNLSILNICDCNNLLIFNIFTSIVNIFTNFSIAIFIFLFLSGKITSESKTSYSFINNLTMEDFVMAELFFNERALKCILNDKVKIKKYKQILEDENYNVTNSTIYNSFYEVKGFEQAKIMYSSLSEELNLKITLFYISEKKSLFEFETYTISSMNVICEFNFLLFKGKFYPMKSCEK